jgi:hypothetical protein
VADWYYIGNYGQLGPLTREQMDELIEGGVIARDTYVWRGGMPQWVVADSCPELSSSFQKANPFTAPPPPPMPGMNPGAGMGMGTATQAPPTPGFTNTAYQPYGSTAGYAMAPYQQMPLGMVKSNKSRILAGILQIILPGVGRMYLGYAATGVIQLVLALCTGVLWLWSLIDGIIMLTGGVKLDGYGRVLED